MTNSSLAVLDPADLEIVERHAVEVATKEAEDTGHLDLATLPPAVREIALSALTALARGEKVATVVSTGRPLTTNQAADLLGVSRTHLTRLCHEGRIGSFLVGSQLRIPADEVIRILQERGRAMVEAREASASAEDRRRLRAAKRAGNV